MSDEPERVFEDWDDRRDLRRMDGLMRKAIDGARESAASVGRAGISQDDPQAVPQLRAKLERLEAKRLQMREANKAHRRAGKPAPFEGYELTNLGARIRTTRQRIVSLGELPDPDAPPETTAEGVSEGMQWAVIERPDLGRVAIETAGRPHRDWRQLFKTRGFKWSKTHTLWVRHLNPAGRLAARQVAAWLRNREESS